MRYLFLFMFLLSAATSSFAMERGGGREFNREGMQQRQDFDRRGYEGNINVNPQVIIPQGQLFNNDAFPDDAEEDQIYQENLQN